MILVFMMKIGLKPCLWYPPNVEYNNLLENPIVEILMQKYNIKIGFFTQGFKRNDFTKISIMRNSFL
jgi:hypothetical protein